MTEVLLAGAVDSLAAANWQRGGGKGPKPKPLPRPGTNRSRRVMGRSNRSATEREAYLRSVGPRREEPS